MSNTNKVAVENIEKEIMKYLQECKENIEDEVKEIADETTKEACKELKQISPKASKSVYLRKSNSKFGVGEKNFQIPGEYASSWTTAKRTSKWAKDKYSKVVYNKQYYRLTHLLEFGHANRDGSRTQPILHIRKTEEKYKEKFKQKLETKITKIRRGI
jgi:hypothetical protein|nr:MAG TPA: putative tail component [Caudoviricetes sp.]